MQLTAFNTARDNLVLSTNTTAMPPQSAQAEQFTLDFGFKHDPVEVEYEGQIGLICEGWGSKYNEEDSAGETQLPGAFSDISETWAAQKEPLVLYNHGLDPTLGARPIGRGIGHKLLPDGLWVKVFIPRDQADRWQDPKAKKRFAEVYNGIKSRVIAAFSVGGAFWRLGTKLHKWSTTELSITPTPCLGSATFSLGAKALTERYGGLPLVQPQYDDAEPQSQASRGVLTRSHFSAVMGFAKQDNDRALHDHLLSYPAEFQGRHDSEDCSICTDRRAAMGVKTHREEEEHMHQTEEDNVSEETSGVAQKAVTKSEDGVAHTSTCYLVVEDPNKPTTWHLRVRDPDGTPNHRLMAAAKAALTSNYRGNPYQGPNKEEALRKLKALYKSEGMEWDDSGSGGKGDLDATEVIQQAKDFLAEYSRGVKAGRRHSKATRDAVAMVVDHLQRTFELGPHDPDGEGSYAP